MGARQEIKIAMASKQPRDRFTQETGLAKIIALSDDRFTSAEKSHGFVGERIGPGVNPQSVPVDSSRTFPGEIEVGVLR